MGVINQKGILEGFNSLFDYSSDPNSVPSSVNPSIQPVIDVNPLAYSPANIDGQTTNDGGGVLYTTPTNTDFYVSFMSISGYIESSGSNGNGGLYTINATVNGVNTPICVLGLSRNPYSPNGVSYVSTTGTASIAITLSTPLRIDRGTNITLERGSSPSATAIQGIVQGFTYNSNAIGLTSKNY